MKKSSTLSESDRVPLKVSGIIENLLVYALFSISLTSNLFSSKAFSEYRGVIIGNIKVLLLKFFLSNSNYLCESDCVILIILLSSSSYSSNSKFWEPKLTVTYVLGMASNPDFGIILFLRLTFKQINPREITDKVPVRIHKTN